MPLRLNRNQLIELIESIETGGRGCVRAEARAGGIRSRPGFPDTYPSTGLKI